MNINVENDAMLGRNNDSIYATKFYVMQKQIDDLQQENKQLKMIVDEYERLNKGFKITNVQEYNIDELLSYKKYKDNWNYIKKMLKEAKQEKFNVNGYYGTCTDVDIDFLLNKMQELEQETANNCNECKQCKGSDNDVIY